MGKLLRMANQYAKMSCLKEKDALLEENDARLKKENTRRRAQSRRMYQKMAEKCQKTPFHQELVTLAKNGDYEVDTYPWPYCAEDFANWNESLRRQIVDQSGFIVKRCTSYCAWKIFEATGRWPQKTTASDYEGRRWLWFLDEAGYPKYGPTIDPEKRRFNFVGINSDYDSRRNELVVWYEKTRYDGAKPITVVSTYEKNVHKIMFLSPNEMRDYTWVEIS